MSTGSLSAILASVALLVAGQTLLKRGMTLVGPVDGTRARGFGRLALDVVRHWQVLVGAVMYLLSAAMWVVVLSRVPASSAYPFLGLSYIGVAATAVLVLGESLTIAQWLGIVLLVSGVVMVTGAA